MSNTVLSTKTEEELLQTILAEVAKAKSEIKCALGDVKKAEGRLAFTILLANEMINRGID